MNANTGQTNVKMKFAKKWFQIVRAHTLLKNLLSSGGCKSSRPYKKLLFKTFRFSLSK